MRSFLRCVCVRAHLRVCEREKGSHHSTSAILIAACLCVCVCVPVCVCEREREKGSHHSRVQPIRNRLNRGLCTITYKHHHCVCHTTLFLSRAWTDGKTNNIINCLYFTLILKAEAGDYGKGHYISDAACGVRPITMHCASWPIRADCACQKEGLCRKLSVWERRGIEDLL